MPSDGIGPQPRISAGESVRVSTPPPITRAAGNSMLPVPRTTLARMLKSQKPRAPANTTFEYVSAVASAQGTRHGRRNAATHAPGRHGLHEHNEGKDQ